MWGSAVALAASLQVIATLPPFPYTALPVPLENEPVIEYDRNPNPLRDLLAGKSFSLHEGKLSIPDGPGIGIELDPLVLEEYTASHKESA